MSVSKESTKRRLDEELDRLEARIAELRVQYEQYFLDVLPQPPLSLHRDVKILIRQLLKAPFKNSAIRFRLRMLIQRYQTYNTYWERVNKQREEGTYSRDVFKAEIRERALLEAEKLARPKTNSEKGMEKLYQAYAEAFRKAGKGKPSINFEAFKKSVIKKANQLKTSHGVKKLHYKVIIKDGKVLLKASAKT